MSFWSIFKLKNEAYLLDSKWYMIKAFFAVMTAYIIATENPILKLDTISVLFGLMLALEPVTLTGIKNGLNQIYATALGAICTAVIICIFHFLGISIVWTIALSMVFTLYVCLKIDWRAVSPVAMFTSIYMTQYIQKTPSGEPSIWLTFRLRLFALGTGVIIAIIFNYIFTLFSYKKMMNKRISFLLKLLIDNLMGMIKGVDKDSIDEIEMVKNSFPSIFNNIDWVYSLFQDMKKEYKYKSKIVNYNKATFDIMEQIIIKLRDITHLNYDITYVLLNKEFQWRNLRAEKNKMALALNTVEEELVKIKKILDNEIIYSNIEEKLSKMENLKLENKGNSDICFYRVFHDLQDMIIAAESIKIDMGKTICKK